MIPVETYRALMAELFDPETAELWGPYGRMFAAMRLGLSHGDVIGPGTPEVEELDEALIASARAAKAAGIPFWKWAEDHPYVSPLTRAREAREAREQANGNANA